MTEVADLEEILDTLDANANLPVGTPFKSDKVNKLPFKEHDGGALFHQLVSENRHYLANFPSTGKDFFQYPALLGELKNSYDKLSDNQVQQLVEYWINNDLLHSQLFNDDPRAIGYLLRTLVTEKTKVCSRSLIQVINTFRKDEPRFTQRYLQLITLVNMAGDIEFIDSSEWDAIPQEVQDVLSNSSNEILNDNIVPLYHVRMGIEDSMQNHSFGQLCFGNGNFLRTHLDEAHLYPLEQMFQDSSYIEQWMPEAKLGAASALLTLQVRLGKPLNELALTTVRENSDGDNKLIGQLLFSSYKSTEVPTNLSESLAPSSEVSKYKIHDAIRELIQSGRSIDKDSFLEKQIKNTEFDPQDISAFIKDGLDEVNGQWNQLDASVRRLLEDLFIHSQQYGIRLEPIFASLIGNNVKELPLFIRNFIKTEEGRKVLEEFDFMFGRSGEPNLNKEGQRKHYLNPPFINLMRNGWAALPETMRTLLQNETDIKNRQLTLLNGVVEYIYEYFEEYSEDREADLTKYDGRFWQLVHEDIWKSINECDFETFNKFVSDHHTISQTGLDLFNRRPVYGNLSAAVREFEELFPPQLKDKIGKQLLGMVNSIQAASKLTKFSFTLTDNVLKDLPPVERNYFRFYRQYPLAAEKLFHLKDSIGDYLDENGLITAKTLELLVNSGYHNEAKAVLKSYLDSGRGNVDSALLSAAINHKCYPGEHIKDLFDIREDIKTLYGKLRTESEQGEWADVIRDPDLFWENNADLLIYLVEFGFADCDFRTFRSFVNNDAITTYLRSRDIPADKFKLLKEKLSIELRHMSYFDYSSLLQTVDETDSHLIFYKSLLHRNPRSFRNAVYSIKNARGVNIEDPSVQATIFSAIDQLGNISPLVLGRYVRETDPVKRLQFVESIKRMKKNMLHNKPVKGDPETTDLLVDFITLAFPGVNISTAQNMMDKLEDRCDDLNGFTVRDEGYDAKSTSSVRIASLKSNQQLDRRILDELSAMFPRQLTKEMRSKNKEKLPTALAEIFRSAGALTYDQIKTNIPVILSIMYDDPAVHDFRKTNFDFSQDENVSTFLSRSIELLGIYFKDNFENSLTETLKENSDVRLRLAQLVSDKRLEQIQRNLSQVSDQDRDKLTAVIAQLKDTQTDKDTISSEDLAQLVTLLIENRIFSGKQGLRGMIKKEHEKFEYKTAEGQDAGESIDFKGFVSKNAASFFAKTTAGVCTAGDVALFNRPDHFHVNLVKGETIVGNIQGYIIEHEGKRALLFRGFNPSSSFVNPSNAQAVCEGMVSIVKQFAADNNVQDVFIAEQLGGWHALTNRVGEGVFDFFKQRYIKEVNEVPFEFPITGNNTTKISKMYRI